MNAAKERVHDYTVALCKAARVFTLEQIAKHPDLSWRTQPRKRAGEFLSPWKKEFEVIPAEYGKPFVWRFSAKSKRIYGADYMRIHPLSKKISHWIRIGDLWQIMTREGGRPTVFMTEPPDSCEFDVYTVWRKKPFLIEIQRSNLSSREWEKKWYKRKKFYEEKQYHSAPWQVSKTVIVPRPILICTDGVKPVNTPTFVKVFSSLEEFSKRMFNPIP